MSEDRQLSSSEVAYRAVLAVQEHARRAENAWTGPDTSNQQSTPLIVWGAFLGFVAGAFGGGSSGFIASIFTMLFSMAAGAGVFWCIGKAFGLFCRLLGYIFREIKQRST